MEVILRPHRFLKLRHTSCCRLLASPLTVESKCTLAYSSCYGEVDRKAGNRSPARNTTLGTRSSVITSRSRTSIIVSAASFSDARYCEQRLSEKIISDSFVPRAAGAVHKPNSCIKSRRPVSASAEVNAHENGH
jgi:hypothetical protein